MIFGIEKNEFVGSTFAINFASHARMSDSVLAHKTGTVLRALYPRAIILSTHALSFLSKIFFCITGFVCLRGGINSLLLSGWIRLDVF